MYGADFELADWAHLPPLDDADLPSEPPPEREHTGGITIGSDLADIAGLVPASGARTTSGHDVTDLGQAVHADLVTVHPGPVELARLGSADFGALDAVQRVDALIALDRQQAWLEACKQQLLGLISVRDRTDQHWCVEEVGAALRLSGGTARTLLADAEHLTQRLPATLTALSEGKLNPAQATAITRGSYPLPDQLLPSYETRILDQAPNQSITALKRSINRTVTALDPATAEQKHQRAVEDRHVRIAPAEHGMAWLFALLPAEDAQSIYARLTNAARTAKNRHTENGHTPSTDDNSGDSTDGDNHERSLDQLRADTLADAVLHGLNNDLPTGQGRRPAVSVIISLATLAGQDDEPGWLDNYGPITAEHARRIAHDPTGTWRRLITDPVTAQLLDYGTTRYPPPPHLTDQVIARDGECTFPYCYHTAHTSDLDHLQPYPHGPTASTNLHPLHRRHHNAKTHAGWKPTRDHHTGHTHWTSPQGRHCTTRPPQRWTTPEPPPF